MATTGTTAKEMSEERAFLMDSFPCNALPFLRRMNEILREGNCNNFPSLPEAAKIDFRACLWVIMGQVHGQAAIINTSNEWQAMADYLRKKGA
jgi:hypothetical protein